MPVRSSLLEYSAAFKEALKYATAAARQSGRDLDKALPSLITVDLRQNRTAKEVLRRLLAGTTARTCWRLVEFGRRLAPYLESFELQAEADAVRRTGTAYVAAASRAAIDRFLCIPQGGLQELHFGVPMNVHGLHQFAALSHAEPDIRRMNPDLTIPMREKLYESWYRRSHLSFLSLFKATPRGSHEPIAVSIILPLRVDARNVLAQRKANLDEIVEMIDGTPAPGVVLIDTWIVKKVSHALKESEAIRREQHRRWAMVMLGRHLAKFVERGRPVSILVEPDFGHIAVLCDLFGFTSRRGGELWELTLPSKRAAVDDRFFDFVEAAAIAGDQPS